jgi:hypothetical protein
MGINLMSDSKCDSSRGVEGFLHRVAKVLLV